MTGSDWDASEHDPDAKHDERSHTDDRRTDRDVIEYRPNREQRGTLLSVAVVLLGVVTIAGTLAIDFAESHAWNAGLIGVALCVFGAYNYYRRANQELGSVGVETLAAIAGLWLVASPFLFGPETGTAGPAAAGTEIGAGFLLIVGLLTFGVGSYSAAIAHKRRREADARPTAVYDRRGQ
ncbi:hypothetical protein CHINAEXTREME_15730 [Halobiforma lacisalsi AJ5]|uniref:SPW repeat-containing integral membrane domain-containing protein n=1 Tax=Natronobacterium lacisalsi AJ5 TaxID=358396 RepID=M0LES0_NATLA|nr:hypothetical protein [Halobiforma lacisalsi]APW99131.1 hypothetical protein CHINAEXTREME_15730 [Halobiforma lacisalsi AJ5]EMA30939.1 hypothetical protein C445_15336 [Halobiforma lacisalsi AJ5]